MSKSAGNATAILLGRSSPAYPTINFQSLYYSGLSEFEKTYVMISVVASQMYGHSNKEINAHHAGHYWHDFGSGDFIHLLKNLDTAVAEFKQSPCYPFFPAPNRMYLSPDASKFVNSSIPQISSNNEDEQTADSYKRIELFLQRYMANHWSVFMTALAKSEPTLTELQKLVTKKGALFIKATTLQLHYSYTIPTTRLHPPPKPYAIENPTTPLSITNTNPVSQTPTKKPPHSTPSEPPADAIMIESPTEEELDPNLDGLPQVLEVLCFRFRLHCGRRHRDDVRVRACRGLRASAREVRSHACCPPHLFC